ncbi:hypothetical protein H6P81_000539 [Aristolochia fimbriata]|uniref:Uncharacterized protein n=1 Tax=Aristolochia fimbriata TaxID=158543 RepID=A0AAV7F877_ARIFI|nr:hypothetical protein H6P81_000539 [Aristolochia fimbriata]
MQAIPVRPPLTVPRICSREFHFCSLRRGFGFARGRYLLNGKLRRNFRGNAFGGEIRGSDGRGNDRLSLWDEKPYELLPGGRIAFLDEQDIVTLLDPPKDLIPLDPASYNPAVYLWKKIEHIPEERRHRLLHLLKPRLVTRMWEMAGLRYGDAKLVQKTSSSLLSEEVSLLSPEFWNCRTSGGPLPIAWINKFKKALFSGKNGQTYGRMFLGGYFLARVTKSRSPLYFKVTELKEVMSTEQPCDLAYEFGDGLFGLCDYPEGFPQPATHPWPFNDNLVIYIRHVGPGVMVGQVWQEGIYLEQVPRRLCSEILMVKEYFT